MSERNRQWSPSNSKFESDWFSAWPTNCPKWCPGCSQRQRTACANASFAVQRQEKDVENGEEVRKVTIIVQAAGCKGLPHLCKVVSQRNLLWMRESTEKTARQMGEQAQRWCRKHGLKWQMSVGA